MSEFINTNANYKEQIRPEIDFEDAIRLPDGGSICEIYRTKWHRHEVFVKRLKEDFRSNPLYLDALDKEYEIGVTLKHPSLPDYREFHRDYIVMDYIDGQTLAHMIKYQDPWLRNEKNIIRMLRELVEVVDYLHRHNVTHCDIKPDNIMITTNNKNLVLIDLDKCYSDSLNETSGDPSKYGLSREQKGRITIDFHGIARVMEIMKEKVYGFNFSRYSTFKKECSKEDPSADDLLQILDYTPGNHNRRFYWMVTIAPFFVALAFGLILWVIQGKDGYDESYGSIISASENSESTEKNEEEKEDVSINEFDIENKPEILKNANPSFPSLVTQEEIHSRAKEMAKVLDRRIQPMFDELNNSLDNLFLLNNNPETTREQLLEEIRKHSAKEDEYFQEAFEILIETYPGISDREAWRVMAYSKAYTGYKRKASQQEKQYSKIIL